MRGIHFLLTLMCCMVCWFFLPAMSSAQQRHAANEVDALLPSSGFGMRLRPAPHHSEAVREPVIIKSAASNEATMIRRSSGELVTFFINRPGDADKMMFISSHDDGISWSAPAVAFDLPGQAYYANQVLEDDHGALHVVFHIFSSGSNGYRGRHLDLWHTQKQPDTDWEKPKKIYDGYVGSMRGFIQLANGRLLLAFARAMPAREQKPAAGETDYGWNETIACYSDDYGDTWELSPGTVNIEVDPTNITRYGGVEPAIIQLTDGRIWMLVRTNKGHLYESFSSDGGSTWSQPEPTAFISSDSPATLLRLRDGRLVVLWSANQRYDDQRSYANGGREVLHAAISSDDGKTWKGFREVLVSPVSSAEKGDRGTAYPSAVENSDGKVVFVSGQAEERALVMFDPDWLADRTARDDFQNGLVQWTFFGVNAGFSLDKLKSGKKKVLSMQTPASAGHAAVWNFPAAESGRITLHFYTMDANPGIELALTDHFSVSHDTLASKHAVVRFSLPESKISGSGKLKVEITWNNQRGDAHIKVNGKPAGTTAFSRNAEYGLNYLRVGHASTTPGGYYLASVKFEAK